MQGEQHRKNPVEYIDALTRSTGNTVLVNCVCRKAGGYFVPNPKNGNHRPKDLTEEENRLMTDVGGMIGLLGRTVKKKAVTRREAADIRKEWEQLKSLTEYFVVCCEQGHF